MRLGAEAAEQGAELGKHVVRGFDQLGTLPEQAVAAARHRVVDRARHREHLAPRLGGQAGGDQRARAARRIA